VALPEGYETEQREDAANRELPKKCRLPGDAVGKARKPNSGQRRWMPAASPQKIFPEEATKTPMALGPTG